MALPYSQRLSLGRLLLAGTLLSSSIAGRAQNINYLNYLPSGATNVAGTYTDLGTTGTVIATAGTDDANSAAQNIGFTFAYDGATFTQFVLNTNGLIRLGAAPPSAVNMFGQFEGGNNPGVEPVSSSDPADVDLLMPFNFDLTGGSSPTEYRVATTGTAPNQVCTIQWKNVADKGNASPTQYANFSFQLKLYQGTNTIEFVYGPATPSTNTPAPRLPTVGIKGSGSVSGQTVLASKTTSGAAWSTTTFITGTYVSSTHNFRANVPPDLGRTYRFQATGANDAGVAAIYTLGKLVAPSGLTHAVQALVANVGSGPQTNLPVTLTVTGANAFTSTKTIPTIAPGAAAVVTFDPYPSTFTTGTNTVTVTVPSDNNNTNNSAAQVQLINTTTQSYVGPDQPTATNGGIGFNANLSGIFAAKYTTSTPIPINSVNVFIANDAATVGNTIYAVVLSATGTILAQSSNYVVQTGDLNAFKTFTFPTAVRVAAGDYYAGLAQTASTTAYFPVGLLAENPTRTGAFFATGLTGGTLNDAASVGLGRFMIEAVTTNVLPTQSAVLGRATTVYPNPSAGVFSLDIRGAGAPQGLAVQVTDVLGRTVYTGSARDNFTTQLDLSQLSTGLYHLTLRNGSEVLTRQLSVAK